MTKKLLDHKISRRRFINTTAGAAMTMTATGIPFGVSAGEKVVKIGFLAPLTGPVSPWGKPGLDGCLIWADWVNTAGGLEIGGDHYKVEFVPYDTEYDPGKARTGATKLIKEDGVSFIMMLGGDTWAGVQKVAEKEGMLFSTLLPSDLTPDTKTLVAPCEVHPIYNVTAIQYIAETMPHLKTAYTVTQDDALGKPSVATYSAAYEVHGIKEIAKPIYFDPATTDFAPVISKLMAAKPDILSLDTCHTPFVHSLLIQAYQQGYKGQIVSCTGDYYTKIIEKTSKEFMEGYLFQFPDFDDVAMTRPGINFDRPNEFYAEYVKRYGAGEWSAVSWEYASIMDLWGKAATAVGSIEPNKVLRSMKKGGIGKHAFGDSVWWGKELFGIDNALVGDWPVVAIEDGKAVIKKFYSVPDWWDQHGDVLVKHMTALGQMWHQRT